MIILCKSKTVNINHYASATMGLEKRGQKFIIMIYQQN